MVREENARMIEENYKECSKILNETTYNHRLKLLNGKKKTADEIMYYAIAYTNGVLRDSSATYIVKLIKKEAAGKGVLVLSKCTKQLTKESILHNMRVIRDGIMTGVIDTDRSPTLSEISFLRYTNDVDIHKTISNLMKSVYAEEQPDGLVLHPEDVTLKRHFAQDKADGISHLIDFDPITTGRLHGTHISDIPTGERLIDLETDDYTKMGASPKPMGSKQLTASDALINAIKEADEARLRERQRQDAEYDSNKSFASYLTLGAISAEGEPAIVKLYNLMFEEMKRIMPPTLFNDKDKSEEQVIYEYLKDKHKTK